MLSGSENGVFGTLSIVYRLEKVGVLEFVEMYSVHQ